MPYPHQYVPRYRKHRASGQAIVTLNGRDFYLGPHGTDVSKKTYDKLLAEWTGNNRLLPAENSHGILLIELIAAFMDYAEQYYRHADGTPTSEVNNFRDVLRLLADHYSELPASEFSPLCLKAVRQKMIDLKWARTNINRQVNRVRTFFKWAASCEHVPVAVWQALKTVSGLKAGRTDARETDAVKPVAEEHVRSVLPHVSSQVAAMLELQLLTGMRSSEVTQMRACDIEMKGDDWCYKPQQHKTAYRGHELRYWIVNRAKEIVAKFLTTDPKPTCSVLAMPRLSAARVSTPSARRRYPAETARV